jgi:NADPH2:quinone reductase
MMRAALIDTHGKPPSVGVRNLPAPRDTEVRVRVTAASITPLDVLCATGTSYFGAPATPYVPGVQGVGELDDGTAAWFATTAGMQPGDGSLAEWAVVPRADVVPLPDRVDHRLVAALGLSAVAAQMSLTWRGNLQHGEHVLVLGGGGVVGQAAIQLALLHGARRVVAACRSLAAADRADRAGATATVRLDEPDFAGRLADSGPFDLVVDPVFGEPAAAALRALRAGGRLVNLGSSAGETAPLDSATIRGRSLSVLGYTNNAITKEQRAGAIEAIADYVRAGRLTLEFETVRLADIGDAWSRQSDGRADRRLVVVP